MKLIMNNPLIIVLLITQLLLLLGEIKAISSAEENAILDTQRALADIPRISRNIDPRGDPRNDPRVQSRVDPQDNDKSGSASHGTSYKSIISNYYTNDPYFGPGAPSGQASKPKYASKDEALQRLKSIINQSKKSSVTEMDKNEGEQHHNNNRDATSRVFHEPSQRQHEPSQRRHESSQRQHEPSQRRHEPSRANPSYHESQNNHPEEIMIEDQTMYHRGMIPAPLLSRVKSFDAEERSDDSYSIDGIPAPLLAGGAYRVLNEENNNNRVLKKSLKIVEEDEREYRRPPIRLKIKKRISKPTFDNRIRRVDDIREKSVFSELIGGQRQEENPETETEIDDETSIDTGLIGDDNEDDVEPVGNRGFFEEPDFGFNSGRETFDFPGDLREDIPQLPEIENLENREPNVYTPRPRYHGGHHYYPEKPDYRYEPQVRGYYPATRTHASSGYPSPYRTKTNNPTYGRLFDKAMNYRNPMDYSHNPKDIEIFEPRKPTYNPYSTRPILKKKSWEVQESYEQPEDEYMPNPDPFFEDIPKIDIGNAIDGRLTPEQGPGPQSERLKRFPSPNIEEALDHTPEYRHPPYESPISRANYDHQYEPNFETHEHQHISEKYQQFIPDENYVQHHQPKFQSLDLEPNLRHTRQPEEYSDFPEDGYEQHHQPKFQSLDFEHNLRHTRQPEKFSDFPSYNDLEHNHPEPNYVADMPHLPPPPEMLELQKNSFFHPHDVPKIGASNAPYRPPELIFDEMHRKVDFPKPKRQFKRKIAPEPYTPEPRDPRPPKPKKYSLRKFSDLEIINQSEGQASTFNNQIEKDYLGGESNQWSGSLPSFDEKSMPSRFDTFDNSPIKSEFRHEKLHQNEPSWISQTQPQQPKIKFDNEPMNYDEFKSRYQQYESDFEPVEISTPRYEAERYYKPEYQTERSSYDYNKPEFQTERSSYDYEQPEFETQRPSYDYKPEPKPDNRYYKPEYQTERSSYDYEQPEFQTQKPNNYESQLEVTVTPQYSEFHDDPVTSKYYQYNDEYASPSPLARSPKPEPVSEPESSQTDLPRRPHPDEFHERIENQLDFGSHSTSEPFYEDEAVKKVTSTPVYNNNARQTTYKYENEVLPVRSENQILEPEPPRRTRQSLYVPEPSPDYYRYDPMNFAKQKTNDDNSRRKKQEVKKSIWESISDFPQILPFEEIDRDFSRRSLDIPQNQGSSISPSFSSSFSPSFSSPSTSRRGAGRALTLTAEEFGLDGFNGLRGVAIGPGSGPRPDPVHDLSKPYQFTHVDAPHTFKAGHSRGNYYHNVKDISEREGPHHLQEVQWNDKHGGYGKHFFEYNHADGYFPLQSGAKPSDSGDFPEKFRSRTIRRL